MKVLVTGAAGFIGSHTVEKIVEMGHDVVGLDNLNDYYDPARKRSNLEEIQSASFTFEELDIRHKERLENLFSMHSFDAVVHLAAMAGVRYSVEDPQLYLDVNLSGTLNLLEATCKHGGGNFIFASTSSAYGNTQQVPFIETDPCDRPLAPYPASKRAAEMLAHSYHHLYGQNVTILRFFTVYGPRGRPDMMAYRVLDNIYFDTKVSLFNDGQMWRDWTYVEDTVQGIVSALDKPLGYEIINLGRGESTLLADFVTQLEKLTGRSANLTPAPKMDADIDRSLASIDKARRLLGYEPTVSVSEGVARFWDWYQKAILQQKLSR